MAEESPLDYEHELGNGWNKYQLLVLGEMKRLADHADRMEELLHQHQIQFATLSEQNRQRDEVLADLAKVCKGLKADTASLKQARANAKARVGTTAKILGITTAFVAWCVATSVSFYSAFTG